MQSRQAHRRCWLVIRTPVLYAWNNSNLDLYKAIKSRLVLSLLLLLRVEVWTGGTVLFLISWFSLSLWNTASIQDQEFLSVRKIPCQDSSFHIRRHVFILAKAVLVILVILLWCLPASELSLSSSGLTTVYCNASKGIKTKIQYNVTETGEEINEVFKLRKRWWPESLRESLWYWLSSRAEVLLMTA